MTPKDYTISIAESKDADALSHIVGLLMDQEVEFTSNNDIQKAGLLAIIENPTIGRILKIEVEGKIIGMINMLNTVSTALGGKAIILEDFVILPEYREQGYGRILFAKAEEIAREDDCLRLTLLTDHDNSDAHRFYATRGMRASTMIPYRKIL